MATEINTRFQIISWTELPFSETEKARKLSKARCTRIFDEELIGESNPECLIAYDKNDSAVYTGYEQFAGILVSKNRSMVPMYEDSFVSGRPKLSVLSCRILVPVILREFKKRVF